MTEKIVFLIAGEPSGDLLGARLIRAIRERAKEPVRFIGVGGQRMQDAGLECIFPYEEIVHTGIVEVLPHVPNILRRIRQTVAHIRKLRPAALVTIDSPDFSLRIAKQLKGAGIPLIHYVAPMVWAWKAGRARAIAQYLDHLLLLLPFEAPYFTCEGLASTFVGHPIVEQGADTGDAARFRQTFGFRPDEKILSVLPGSRKGEIGRLMPSFTKTVEGLKALHPNLRIVIPTLPHLVDHLGALTKDWALKPVIFSGDQNKYDAFAASTAALACSGTLALELAIARLPTIIAYRLKPLSAWIVGRMLKVRFWNLVNIMHDRMVVPELREDYCRPDYLIAHVDALLASPGMRERQIVELSGVAAWLGQGETPPSHRAAKTVMDIAGIA